MQERVRIFTDTTGTVPTAIETRLEDEITAWPVAIPGRFGRATQLESRSEKSAHLTAAVWYLSEELQSKVSPDISPSSVVHDG